MDKLFYYKSDAKEEALKRASFIQGSMAEGGLLTSDRCPDTDDVFDEKCPGGWSGETSAFKIFNSDGSLNAIYGWWTDEEKKKKRIWLRLGGLVSADDETLRRILKGDEKALKEAIMANGFEVDGDTYVPNNESDDINFDLDGIRLTAQKNWRTW